MYRYQSAFSLIELMVAVAIIGIITAIAVPTYRNYIIRAKVSELLLAGANAKISVAEFAQTLGTLDGAGAGLVIDTEARFVSKTHIADNGAMTLTALAADIGSAEDVTISLRPALATSGVVTWTCSSTSNPDYLPASCR